jgi:hypothetical protein
VATRILGLCIPGLMGASVTVGRAATWAFGRWNRTGDRNRTAEASAAVFDVSAGGSSGTVFRSCSFVASAMVGSSGMLFEQWLFREVVPRSRDGGAGCWGM